MSNLTTDYSVGPVDDQLIKYDTAVLAWLQTDFDIIPGKTTKYLVSTPHHGYAEAIRGSDELNQGKLTVPRISLSRGDYVLDSRRFNPNIIRRLGRPTATHDGLSNLRQGQYPAPISIPYQIDFWCEFVRDMNFWIQKFLFQFAYSYKYLQINVDTVWTDKKFCIFSEGGLANNSDLDLTDTPREIRYTASLRADAWIYDQSFAEVPVVKRIELETYDDSVDPATLMSRTSPNRRQDLFTTPGTLFVFTGGVLVHKPILANTFILSAYFSGTEYVAEDDGSGLLYGTHVASGTIDYTTGVVDITYSVAPDAGDLEASWLTDLS